MQHSTQPDREPTIPSSYAWCSWCHTFSGTARLVRIIEQGSGPGGGVFACRPCRSVHGLVPVADQP
jgi:hypothetical protein